MNDMQIDKQEQVVANESSQESIGESIEESKLILDVAPAESIRFHKPVMVGDVKLSEFRSLLNSRGFTCEFASGVLVVNKNVIVRKEGSNLTLEGRINADYFSVRRLLYEMHAIV